MIATEADLPRILEFARAFHGYSPWSRFPLDESATETYARNIMADGVIFISETGFIGGVLMPIPFAPQVVLAVELFWWGDGALKAEFEEWAKAQGATAVQFSALADDRSEAMARLFARNGYRPAETGYLKEF